MRYFWKFWIEFLQKLIIFPWLYGETFYSFFVNCIKQNYNLHSDWLETFVCVDSKLRRRKENGDDDSEDDEEYEDSGVSRWRNNWCLTFVGVIVTFSVRHHPLQRALHPAWEEWLIPTQFLIHCVRRPWLFSRETILLESRTKYMWYVFFLNSQRNFKDGSSYGIHKNKNEKKGKIS